MSRKKESKSAEVERSEDHVEERRSGGIGTTLLTAVAALAGTVVGNGVRLVVKAKMDDTESEIEVSGVFANAIAAAALAHTARRRRPLVAFMLGAGLTAATGDMPDRALQELFATDLDGFVAMDQDEPDGV